MSSLLPMMRGFVVCHRAVATRAFSSHWQELANFVPKSKRKDILAGSLQMTQRMKKADAASTLEDIDWASYESILGKDVVGPMKVEYEATPITQLDAEIESSISQSREKMDSLKGEVDRIAANAKPIRELAAKELAVLEMNRTDEDTTLEEVARRYPKLHKQAMQKIADENYDISHPAVDVAAVRLKTVKENWDSGKSAGKLNEDNVNAVISEMEALEAPRQLTWKETTWANFSAEQKATVKRLHEDHGKELTEAAIRDYDALEDPFSLTADELALTDEGELYRAIFDELDKENAIPDRALHLYKQMERLRSTGQLVPNPDAVEDMTIPPPLPPGRLTEADFEGKSYEELIELSEKCAKADNYYAASLYMYEAQVIDGKIDPAERGTNSYSSMVNMMMQMSENVRTVQKTGKIPQFAFST